MRAIVVQRSTMRVHSLAVAGAGGDPKISDVDHHGPKIDDEGRRLAVDGTGGGPKINDEGHQLAVAGAGGDPKINDAIDDEGHRDTSVSALSDSQDSTNEDGFIDEGHSSSLVIDTDAIDADDDESDGGMEVATQASKREQSDGSSSDSLDGSPLCHRKKDKTIGHALSRLLTVASATPFPDDDERSPDLICETPVDPNNVDEPSSYVNTDCTDYPLTQPTPIVKPSVSINSASQSSSLGLKMFLFQKTHP